MYRHAHVVIQAQDVNGMRMFRMEYFQGTLTAARKHYGQLSVLETPDSAGSYFILVNRDALGRAPAMVIAPNGGLVMGRE